MSQPPPLPPPDTVPWTLHFISGKYQGGEFPLRPNREIIIGRSSDIDMVLVEDMVSRRHAKISTDQGGVSIQDLGSTNGTFVNGEKIRKVELKDGDRILIGTSIIKLVALNGTGGVPSISESDARSRLQVSASRKTTSRSMSGSIEEIPLPDLLQLFSTSRKSAVLVVRSDAGTGRIFFRQGHVFMVTIDESPDVSPRKAMYRMLTWTQGFFELEPPDDRPTADEIQDSTEALLMEGMRQLDEFRLVAGKVPPLATPIHIPKPMPVRFRDLAPDELDIMQAAMGADTVQRLLDASPRPDRETAEIIARLLERGYLIAG